MCICKIRVEKVRCTHVDETVAGSLRTNQRSTPRSTLSSQNTLPPIAFRAVRSEHPANLARRNADVAGGHVGVRANVLVELPHEGDAELADLVIGLALGVEIGATFAAAHVDCAYVSVWCSGKDAKIMVLVAKEGEARTTHGQ
jgi:hypothetical protein